MKNSAMNLTTKQKQYLKQLAHDLKPVVMIGQYGLTEGVLAEIDLALNHHELIKVKIAAADRDTKKLIAEAIIRETSATQVQLMGSVLSVYRQSEDKKIVLPK